MSERRHSLALRDGSRVAVVGAGPSGSIFACQVLRLAHRHGIDLRVTIFDKKPFLRHGPQGCNLCAGVVCPGLLRRLREMGVELPDYHTQRFIDGYRLHMRSGQLRAEHAATHGPIATVYRGAGPRSDSPHVQTSFDDFLLKHALSLGAEHRPCPVEGLGLPRSAADPVVVHYREEHGMARAEAELVAVGCGVNSAFPARLEGAGFGYRSPSVRRGCQAEIPLPREYIDEHFDNDIHVLALGLPRIRFAALVPKRRFVTLTLIGHADVGPEDLHAFVGRPEVLQKLPAGWQFSERYCHCYPLMPVSSARNPVTDRLVVIGDAALSRYCKNGLGSAYVTATAAARAAVERGVSGDALRTHYWRPVKRRIARDNLYGRALAVVGDAVMRNPRLAHAYLDASQQADHRPGGRTFHFVNWNMITGDRPFREVAGAAASAPFAAGLARSALDAFLRGRGAGEGKGNWLGPLRDGQAVAVIGAGPAGTSCALTLRRLAAQKGVDVDVLLYEAKDLSGGSQYNQCAGVLSPPIVEVLEQHVGVPFPQELVQREIDNYLFRGETENITLSGDGGPSLALRRIEFDRYMFNKAQRAGVRISSGRVEDVEIDDRGVRVFSEKGSRLVDAVVGAFGLDQGTAAAFARSTGYRPPACMETLVTKLHLPPRAMERHGGTAYAFLPPFRGVEFAAIVPKANHLTVVLAGRRLKTETMDRLLAWAPVRDVIRFESVRDHHPEYFKGRFPVASAREIYGDRYVMVGDASGLVRPFKGKGVTTACTTGHLAARTMVERGIGREALAAYYSKCGQLAEDILFGRIVRKLVGLLRRAGALDELIRQARSDGPLRDAMYSCASGEGTFRAMLARTFGLARGARVTGAVLKGLLGRAPVPLRL